jgi:histidinol phosphatase-like PHP family hydrolase
MHSCDASKIPEDAVITAIKNGLSGISITDHSDLRLFYKYNIPEEIPASCREADMLAEKYKGKIQVFSGIESRSPLPSK